MYYVSKDQTRHIATDKSRCAIVTKTDAGTTVSTFKFPFVKQNGELYDESTGEEFIKAYDDLTDFVASLSEPKQTNGKGVRTLLPEAPQSYK